MHTNFTKFRVYIASADLEICSGSTVAKIILQLLSFLLWRKHFSRLTQWSLGPQGCLPQTGSWSVQPAVLRSEANWASWQIDWRTAIIFTNSLHRMNEMQPNNVRFASINPTHDHSDAAVTPLEIIWLLMTVWSKRGNINTAALVTIAQCNTLIARYSRQLIGPADSVFVTLGLLRCD